MPSPDRGATDVAVESAVASPLVLAWRLQGVDVLVVGAGAIAEGKVELLRGTGARVTVVAPVATDRIRHLAATGQVRWRSRAVRRHDVVRPRLVFVATSEREINRRVRRWAKLTGAVVNVVDDPELCDVTTTSVVRRGNATISVTTAGSSPAVARFLRERLERMLPEALGDLVDAAANTRRHLRRQGMYTYDYPMWRDGLFEPGWHAVCGVRPTELTDVVREFAQSLTSPAESSTRRVGHVTLVGAGPGGVDLITRRGAEALATADLVVYDRLSDPALLDLAPVVARRVPVGKGKAHGVAQDEINRILIEGARAGEHVVRLKGGDPFVFGRGAEESDAVRAAGFACDIVPGVSSALAAPALAGVPLTLRGVSAAFVVLTGHRIAEHDHDWDALARSGATLVVLMGASTGDEVARRLLRSGRPPAEPVCVVHRGGQPEQEVALITLCSLAEHGCPLPAPSVIVIGEVAARAAPTGVEEGASISS